MAPRPLVENELCFLEAYDHNPHFFGLAGGHLGTSCHKGHKRSNEDYIYIYYTNTIIYMYTKKKMVKISHLWCFLRCGRRGAFGEGQDLVNLLMELSI